MYRAHSGSLVSEFNLQLVEQLAAGPRGCSSILHSVANGASVTLGQYFGKANGQHQDRGGESS